MEEPLLRAVSLHDALPIFADQRMNLDGVAFDQHWLKRLNAHAVKRGGIQAFEPVLVDRKSTRLNSSHRCISYAVFCLKKKSAEVVHVPLLDGGDHFVHELL